MADESHLFDNLSDDDLNKEAPTDFFETPTQREQFVTNLNSVAEC